jgi:hypothetical protein
MPTGHGQDGRQTRSAHADGPGEGGREEWIRVDISPQG